MFELLWEFMSIILSLLELILRTSLFVVFCLVMTWLLVYLIIKLSEFLKIDLEEYVFNEEIPNSEKLRNKKVLVLWFISLTLFLMLLVEMLKVSPNFYRDLKQSCENKFDNKVQIELNDDCKELYYKKIIEKEEKLNKEIKLREYWLIKNSEMKE